MINVLRNDVIRVAFSVEGDQQLRSSRTARSKSFPANCGHLVPATH